MTYYFCPKMKVFLNDVGHEKEIQALKKCGTYLLKVDIYIFEEMYAFSQRYGSDFIEAYKNLMYDLMTNDEVYWRREKEDEENYLD